jgi:hypothetical protein
MKFPKFFQNLSSLELGSLILFILYIVFPIETPVGVSNFIQTPLGILVLFCITIFLFFYTNPILGVLYLFVAFELVRRSSVSKPQLNQITADSAIIQHTPTEAERDSELISMNPPSEITLEEEMVHLRAPSNQSASIEYVSTSFKPVADQIPYEVSVYR